MFISVFQVRHLKEAIKFAPYIVVGSLGVFGLATSLVGLSAYLLPALGLPFVEFFIRFRRPTKGPGPLICTLLIFMIHAIFLGILQQGNIGLSKLAVNFQYVSLVSLSLGVGTFLFKTDILTENEAW